jgi:hypothetical protein
MQQLRGAFEVLAVAVAFEGVHEGVQRVSNKSVRAFQTLETRLSCALEAGVAQVVAVV